MAIVLSTATVRINPKRNDKRFRQKSFHYCNSSSIKSSSFHKKSKNLSELLFFLPSTVSHVMLLTVFWFLTIINKDSVQAFCAHQHTVGKTNHHFYTSNVAIVKQRMYPSHNNRESSLTKFYLFSNHNNFKIQRNNNILFSTQQSSNNNDKPNKLRSRLTVLFTKLKTVKPQQRIRSLVVKYKSLSNRAKRILIIQMAVFIFLFGSIASKYTTQRAADGQMQRSRRPIEISYSSFLDLIEQQKEIQTEKNQNALNSDGSISLSTINDNSKNIPVISHLRIGTDRYVFRLYQANKPSTSAAVKAITPSTSTASTSVNAIVSSSSTTEAMDATTTNAESTATKGPTKSKSLFKVSSSVAPIQKILSRFQIKSAQLQQQNQKEQHQQFVTAYTRPVSVSDELLSKLRDNDISFTALRAQTSSVAAVMIRSAFITFYFLIMWRLYKTMANAGGSGKGDVPGKLADRSIMNKENTSFDDIQGIDEVKVEVMELVDALRNPEKYAILGARAPTGLLLEGPPGTGKTMLARATAASAGVPLLYCSGSDFVEMFVGRGAARVRRLFERAERLSPCIIFIDELDALGKSRDMGLSSFGGASRSNDEAEQTLNQLLACMDGLDSSRRVCVLAATNRKEVLDPALIRPGRFDRIVKLKLPDAAGREAILRVHTRKLPGFAECSGVDPKRPGALGKGRLVDLSAIAAITDGFSGAELEYLVNEAAIRAVRRVSSALQRGIPNSDIVPHAESRDFEESLKSFYETRKPRSPVNDMFKNVWKQ